MKSTYTVRTHNMMCMRGKEKIRGEKGVDRKLIPTYSSGGPDVRGGGDMGHQGLSVKLLLKLSSKCLIGHDLSLS